MPTTFPDDPTEPVGHKDDLDVSEPDLDATWREIVAEYTTDHKES